MAFEIQSATERLESVAGLALAGEIARTCGLSKLAGDNLSLNDVLSGMFGLLVQGRSSYEEIDLYRGNDFFRCEPDLHGHRRVCANLQLHWSRGIHAGL